MSERYEGSFLELFDTVTTVVGYAESEEAFTDIVQGIYDEMSVYHELYDIYNSYDGVNNLKTVNDNAGVSPVKVDGRIIDLLEFCWKMYDETDGKVNIAMGSVLELWHDERTYGILNPDSAKIPDMNDLEKANEHTDIGDIIIDRENSTVYITDPGLRIDVGAVAKGYAAGKIAESLPEGFLMSVGGNVVSTGAKPGGENWGVGVDDPFGEEDYIYILSISGEAVVSSGIYQRNYVVGDKLYHHIIDPVTLMPAEKYAAVTVICNDSAASDALSTALFLSDIKEGEELLEKYGAEALWVYNDGTQHKSKGFDGLVK